MARRVRGKRGWDGESKVLSLLSQVTPRPSRLAFRAILVLSVIATLLGLDKRSGAQPPPDNPLLFDLGPLNAIPAAFQISTLAWTSPNQAGEEPILPSLSPRGLLEDGNKGGGDGVGTAEGPPSLDVLFDARFLFLSGFVSAREHTIEGNRFDFGNLKADFGENIGVAGRWSISPSDRLELRAAYFNLRGSTTIEQDKIFNNTTLEGGTSIESKPDWLEFRLTYLRELFALPSIHSSFWFLFGLDYHYINWIFGATLAPTTRHHEPKEDFYLQTFPLPVFGARYLLDLGPHWSFDLRADAFRANHWRHWANEGGPIYTSSTIIDVLGILRWQPAPWFFAEAGYTFNYYTLDEEGPEDGNHLLVRGHGPVVGIGLSW